MRKVLIFLLLGFAYTGIAQAQMSDDEIAAYIKSAASAGKSEQQIGEELITKGVTIEQLQYIKQNIERRSGSSLSSSSGAIHHDARFQTAGISPVGQPEGEHSSHSSSGSDIFGHDMFHSKSMSFEPNENAATPANYKLGPGDEVNVDIWGTSEASFKQKISPEGIIMIPQVGALTLSGLTLKQATEKIRHAVSRRYAGLGVGGSTQISVTLGHIRTINVHLMGEVEVPGTYRLSSFTTLFNAMYRAGGVTGAGSLRNVRIVRDGATVDTVDIYEFFYHGSMSDDLSLHDGDVIIVPQYDQMVTIEGQVRRPMRYELKRGETLADAIRYAGGFSTTAYTDQLKLIRKSGREKQIFTLNEADYSQFVMADGDIVSVESNLKRFENMVLIEGAVLRPGEYELGGSITTVKELIAHADGLTPDAFLGRAVIIRENEDLSLRTLAIDLEKVMNGENPDITLQKNDMLVISKINSLQDIGPLYIMGWVNHPGSVPYADNTTIEDMVVRAGGFKHGASTIRADVARRIYDPKSNTSSGQLAQVFTMEFTDELSLSENNFILEPYDIVIVRRSPDYHIQKKVTIKGEVLFPGEYILTSSDERLSSIVNRAGGLTKNAYANGCRLRREVSAADRKDLLNAMENIDEDGRVTGDIRDQAQSLVFPIGIQLTKAMKRPNCDYDVVLQDGDEITIPSYNGIVRINGEVMRPNAVSYVKGKHARYYINQAGGFSSKAKRCRTYVVYPNGTMSRARWCTRIEPGSDIIVPQKVESKPVNTTEVLALSTAAASMVSVIIALIKLF